MQSLTDTQILFYTVFSISVIYDSIFSFLSPRQLFCFTSTCRDAFLSVSDYNKRAYNINRHLSRFFKDPLAFRSLQACTGTVISGSSALQFLDRTLYPDSDLDVYCYYEYARQIIDHIISVQGYTLMPPPPGSPREGETLDEALSHPQQRQLLVHFPFSTEEEIPYPSVRRVVALQKMTDNGPTRIEVIVAKFSPLQCVLEFHSTCVMNLITHDTAYSLYPLGTFEHRQALSFCKFTPRTIACLEKYRSRGWVIQSTTTNVNLPIWSLNQTRRVGDRHTWTKPLDVTGLKKCAEGALPVKMVHNSWSLDRSAPPPWQWGLAAAATAGVNADSRIFAMRFSIVWPRRFRFAYVVVDSNKADRIYRAGSWPTGPFRADEGWLDDILIVEDNRVIPPSPYRARLIERLKGGTTAFRGLTALQSFGTM